MINLVQCLDLLWFKFIQRGEYVNKDLKIKQISLENEIVTFTNGDKEFKLEFSGK